ncbi:MAG: ribosome-associated translation inhibitor RaiA [bacterium]
MEIIVKGKGVSLTEALKGYANKKIGHLEHFFANIQKVEITLEVDPIREADRAQNVHATAFAARKVIHANAESKDLYAAIDLVLDKLVEQIKKHKSKMIKEHRRHGPHRGFMPAENTENESVQA